MMKVCDNRDFMSSKIREIRDRNCREIRDNLRMAQQTELQKWIASKLEERGHGARKALAEHLGYAKSDVITRMLNFEPGKESRRVTFEDLQGMASFFGEAPPGLDGQDPQRIPIDEAERNDYAGPIEVDAYAPESYEPQIPGGIPQIDVEAGAGLGHCW